MRVVSFLWLAVLGLASCHKVEESSRGPSASQVTTKNLRAVWGSGPTDVWAAGDKGTILHFDGKVWAPSVSGTDEDLTGLTGTGPTNVYASGQKGTILHWDGQGWRQVSGSPETALVHMWSSGPDDVWAVGLDTSDEVGVMRHWNGTKWESQAIPGSGSLWGIGGTGPTDVSMVGSNSNGKGYVIHGDGKHFDANGYKGPAARAVWCARPDDVWVAPYQGALQHWNGTAWAEATTPDGSWSRMGGSGPDDVWAVGTSGQTLHFRGGAWTTPATGTNQMVWSVWSSSPTSAWAVGNNGTLLLWNGFGVGACVVSSRREEIPRPFAKESGRRGQVERAAAAISVTSSRVRAMVLAAQFSSRCSGRLVPGIGQHDRRARQEPRQRDLRRRRAVTLGRGRDGGRPGFACAPMPSGKKGMKAMPCASRMRRARARATRPRRASSARRPRRRPPRCTGSAPRRSACARARPRAPSAPTLLSARCRIFPSFLQRDHRVERLGERHRRRACPCSAGGRRRARSRRSSRRSVSQPSRSSSGRAKGAQPLSGRRLPPSFVAMTRSFGYGWSVSAMRRFATCGP